MGRGNFHSGIVPFHFGYKLSILIMNIAREMENEQSYKAVLVGNRLAWSGDGPGISGPLDVTVVVHDDEDPAVTETRRRRALAALEEIAAHGGFASIPDPVAWQREIRRDRPLPGRDRVIWTSRDGEVFEFTHLSPAERLKLAQQLWASVAASEVDEDLTPAERTELDCRLPGSDRARPWVEVREELRHELNEHQ